MWKPSVTPSDVIRHSQGPWEDHKYVKVVDDKYYYPNSYDNGRTVSDLKGTSSDSSKATRSDYSKDDSDFNDKNYNDKNLLGDTDFYGFKGKDGKNVILMEDKKWTLPEGTKLDSALTKRLEKVSKEIEERREKGEKISADEWNKLVEDAINGTSGKKSSSKSSSKSSKSSSGKSSSKSSGKEKSSAGHQLYESIKKEMEQNQKAKEKERRRRQNVINRKAYLNHADYLIWAPTTDSDELCHHGVQGQKWGVRRYQNKDGTRTSAGKKRYYTDNGYKKKGASSSKKKASQMSNKELKRKIERKQLEQRYDELNSQQINRGRQKVMSIVRDYATIAGAAATTAAFIRTVYKIKTGDYGK